MKRVDLAHWVILTAALAVLCCSGMAYAGPPPCDATAARHAVALSGEVAGARNFGIAVGPGWTFLLEPDRYGWNLRLRAADGVDLSQVTPPFHGTNARQLFGWHFRNRDNTASNSGEINAPQRLRLFTFSPEIEGTGGFKPPRGNAGEVQANGRGWIYVHDFGLADLEPGQRARMVYLRFGACLTWPKSQEEIAAAADAASPRYLDEEIEIFASCGLQAPYRLRAYLLPRLQAGDFDGDGALDSAAPVVRERDQKHGLAVCRSGSRLELIGFDRPIDGLEPGYFERAETWRVQPGSDPTDTPHRRYARDVITIERVEKSSYTIYWHDDRFRARRD